ncbi:MAG: glutamine--tRNA ligase/YqeY domain fusion protein [Clostridiales bacterium]|nr:glutamine--tRNA ligase/YqeY domain fusion protein [Clostridiales bacterium]
MNDEGNRTEAQSLNFIEEHVVRHLKEGGRPIITRFPPEPNGYLHIGHAKAITIDFGLAAKYGGKCNLRFDDTNPVKEDTEYVDSIMEDIRWLGFDWEDRLYYASDYFGQLYEFAELLIRKGKAFVCDHTAEQMRAYRGTLTQPGKNSPYRDRTVEENLRLFRGMRDGKYDEGQHVLRAKIDMASPNMNMRDPVIYRVMKASHHRTGDEWCVYPMYDFAHPLSDAVEGITHSLCTLEFEDHRPLYDWFVNECEIEFPPHQYEFARLNLTRTVMSKRFLKRLVDGGAVSGWDDPRMPTLCGLRRRGYTPQSIRSFCEKIGVAKSNSTVDAALLEHCVREDLKLKARRLMAVLRPLKVVLTNYPESGSETLVSANNAENPGMGARELTFSRELYIEREDFMEDPPPRFHRLAPGREARLKDAYIIRCEDVVRDAQGGIEALLCTYDPETKSGMPGANRKVKGTLHWVGAKDAVRARVRLYDYLLDDNEDNEDLMSRLNPHSVEELTDCLVEPALAQCPAGERFQFLRLGYFCADSVEHTKEAPVYNRIVGLKDTWAKLKGRA